MGDLGLVGAIRGKVKRTTIADPTGSGPVTWSGGSSRRCRPSLVGSRFQVSDNVGRLDTTPAAKHTLPAIARRWLALYVEIKTHEQILNQLTADLVPDSVAFGIGADIAAEMLIVAASPERIRSESAFAKLCGVAPSRPPPASSGLTTRHRLNRGGHRQANSTLYPAVIVRLKQHDPTQAHFNGCTAKGRTKGEIIRCLKRLLAREIWGYLRALRQARHTPVLAA